MNCIHKSFVLPIELYEDHEYNKLRRAYLLLIASLISEHLIDQDINDFKDTIIQIEKSCYNHSIEIAEYEMLTPDMNCSEFECLYRTRITRITKNLDINSEVGDDYLVNRTIAKNNNQEEGDEEVIDIENISKLKPEELSPAKNKEVLDLLEARRNQGFTLKVSTSYLCKKCFKKETIVKSKQMRSLDEGETLSITCTFCGNKWFA